MKIKKVLLPLTIILFTLLITLYLGKQYVVHIVSQTSKVFDEVEYIDREGSRIRLRGIGKPVFVNFWATWCKPCIAEMPVLEVVSRHFSPKGWIVLALSGEEEDKVWGFIDRSDYDLRMYPMKPSYDDIGNYTLPYSYILDANGKKVWEKHGGFNLDDTTAIILELERLELN